MSALAALIVAVTGLAIQVRDWHRQVNSRMDELLDVTRTSARAEGRLEGPLT
jgi:hypothetical protein